MAQIDVEATVGDGSMRMVQATPDGDATHGVIVIPEAFGLNGHIESVARRFADDGMIGLAIDIFHRSGAGVGSYDDFATVAPLFEHLSDEGQLDDLRAGVDHLRTLGLTDDRIAVVGFCFGGRTAFLAALELALGGAITYYGGGIVRAHRLPGFGSMIERVGELRTPWLGLFGDEDQSIPVEDVEALRSALDSAGADAEIVRYADAGHGFNCDERPAYHAESAADAWQRMIAFIRRD